MKTGRFSLIAALSALLLPLACQKEPVIPEG